MQNRNRAELHIADHLLDRRVAAWQNWKQLVVAFVRLALKTQEEVFGHPLVCTCVASRTESTSLTQKVLEFSTDSSTEKETDKWHHRADTLRLEE